ncbi:hypothetical protein E3U23_00995 [Erythrobacter litoralis]|uniref:sulfatase-like hydrolase/transferase n=1 Tax=Erythrobacter litoralis TaxID=39960 RepID=UPI002434DA3F|nr:sulfatase-like hydrolase/transferase [Erythrobacter litoralis]MDG6077775.1 hypothetical protein [Erythrobacter litoralis]
MNAGSDGCWAALNLETGTMRRYFCLTLALGLLACGGDESNVTPPVGNVGNPNPAPAPSPTSEPLPIADGPNIVFIIVDDLNDYVEGFGGHPQAYTPNIKRLMQRGVSFTNAHANAPLCSPSRASLLSGYLPSTTGKYHSTLDFRQHELLSNAKLMPEVFRDAGYAVYLGGKVFHGTENDHRLFGTNQRSTQPKSREGVEGGYIGPRSSFGPIPWDGQTTYYGFPSHYIPKGDLGKHWEYVDDRQRVDLLPDGEWNSNPDLPNAIQSWVFGYGRISQAPIFRAGMNSSYPVGYNYAGFAEYLGQGEFSYRNSENRSLMSDEKVAIWASDLLRGRVARYGRGPSTAPLTDRSFLMMLGLVKTHAPLYVPDSYFDEVITANGIKTIDDVSLPPLYEGQLKNADIKDIPLSARFGEGFPRFKTIMDGGAENGTIPDLINPGSFIANSQDRLLKSMILSYLAAVNQVDSQVGVILDALDANPDLRSNTIIVLTSDNGWSAGEKNYWGKNNLWNEATRIPLVIVHPDTAYNTSRGSLSEVPASLVDLYPTLLGMAIAEFDEMVSGQAPFDGQSLIPALVDPVKPEMMRWPLAISSLFSRVADKPEPGNPSSRNHSVRSASWRYTLTSEGEEELYNQDQDPNEWYNIANDVRYDERKATLRRELEKRVRIADE